jgi:hypothetical protein
MKKILIVLLLGISFGGFSQELKNHQKPGLYNPIVPGYFADPTIKKIGDTFYMYATTDGNGWGAGPSQVWISKDFVNWSLKPMNWPNTHWYWAPDMIQGYDKKYYLYYSQPVEIFGASSDSPVGPWTPLKADSTSVIPNYMIPGVITLDAQTFKDDDGKIYMFWGTWGIYPDHGCAVGLLNEDMKSFSKIELIPNTVAKDFFEAPFMFKRNGIYYMMYSSGRCEDHTYRVQYVKSTTGPFGPYEYPSHNPILVTNEDGSVHGPGHHSVLQEGDDYYIVYHRHNNPNSGGGFHRQIAADKMFFDEKGDIINVAPTHEGIGFIGKNTLPYKNQILGKTVTSSSDYNEDFRAEFVADDNNGTLWRAKDNMSPAWIQVDLGEVKQIKTVLTQFEYATWFYEYMIEYSTDGKNWSTFADKRNNRVWGSPIVDKGNAPMRFIKLHIFDTQLAGLPKGIWNLKAFEKDIEGDFYTSEPQKVEEKSNPLGLLIDISADAYLPGQSIKTLTNSGKLNGRFITDQSALVTMVDGKKAFVLSDKNAFVSDFKVPVSLSGNSSFTVVADIYNDQISRYEPFLSWSKDRQDLAMAEFGYGSDRERGAITHGSWANLQFKEIPEASKWHRIAFTFDGYIQKIWVDGKLLSETNKMLYVRKGENFVLGSDIFRENYFEGAISSLQVYDKALSKDEIFSSSKKEESVSYYFSSGSLDYESAQPWKNDGSKSGVADSFKISDKNGKQSVVFSGENLLSKEAKQYLEAEKDAKLVILASPLSRNSTLYKNKALNSKDNLNEWYTLVLKPTDDLALDQTAVSKWMITKENTKELQKAWDTKTDFSFLESAKKDIAYSGSNDILVLVTTDSQRGLSYYFANGKKNSGWVKQTHYLFEQADTKAPFTVKTKDEHGNVSKEVHFSKTLKKTKELTPELTSTVDFLNQRMTDFWDDVLLHANRDTVEAEIAQDKGEIKLASIHSSWSGSGKKGPFLYKEVAGDFTFTAQLSDLIGKKEKRNTSSEAGIMVRNAAGTTENHIQNTILTGWNIGNMTTHVLKRRRIQKNNGSAWNYMPYLQIQKLGDTFFLRASHDGMKWTELPGSPISDKELAKGKIAVGLFQASNNNVKGFGSFKNIRLHTNE